MASADAPPSFEQAALPHLDAAYNLARWLVRDPVLAEDVVQDAIVRALTYFRSFRGGSARAWLLQIVRTTAYDRLAERRGEAARESDTDMADLDVADPAEGPEAAMARKQGAEEVNRALASLPPELRECLVLRELEELSYREIGRVLGVPIGTVMSRLWRARQALMRVREKVEP
jgi:RNA polymerase sigma-70 factor (ECF subfamily)